MKRLLAIVHDVVVAGCALGLALVLRYGTEDLPSADDLLPAILVFCGIAGVVFRLFGLSRGMWRFASVTDLRQIVIAATVVVLSFLFAMFTINRLESIPRSVPAIAWFVLVVGLGAPRLLYRAWKDGGLNFVRPAAGMLGAVDNLLIVGSVSEADRVIRALGGRDGTSFRVVGIVEPGGKRTGRGVRGVQVLGGLDELGKVVGRLGQHGLEPTALVIAAPREDKVRLRAVTDAAVDLGLPVRRLVQTYGLDDAAPTLTEVTVEDLLGRPPVHLDLGPVREFLADRVVLVTGAGGSIGSEIVRQVAELGPARLVLVDHGELALYEIDLEMSRRFPSIPRVAVLASVRDRERIRRVFDEQGPAVVFHAAALKHVPLVEENVCEGVLTNVVGTKTVADAALAAGALAFVMISTDKAIRPSSVMGATKRVAEAYCQSLDVSGARTRFVTVRFGNVLGSTGSVVPLFRRQIEAGGPVTVTDPEMRRYFMTVGEATELVLQAAAAGVAQPEPRGRIFVLDMGEPVRIDDLARTMIALAGLRPERDIAISYTGLRPGEKLFEEIFDAAEGRAPTVVEGVFSAAARMVDAALLEHGIGALRLAAEAGDAAAARRHLAGLVPELPSEAPPLSSVA